MRKTLIAVAFAGAALAPAAALTTAATLAPVSAAVAAPKIGIIKGQRHQHVRRRLVRRPILRHPVVRRPDFRLAARCFLPRVSIRHEMLRLRHAGFRRIHYAGRRTFLPRCAQFLYFTACRGFGRYRVIVRYIRFQRFVITQRLGACLPYYRTRRPYRHTS